MPEKEKNGKLKKLGRVLSGKDYVLGNERVAKIANKNKISKKDKKKYPYIEAYAKEGIAPSDYKNVIKSGTFNPRTDTAVVAEGKYTKDHRRFKDHFQKRIDKKVNNNFTEAVSSSGNKNTTKLSGYRDDPFVKKSEFDLGSLSFLNLL